MAFLGDIVYDADLGLASVNGKTTTVVRMLVSLVAADSDDEAAVPDSQCHGLRVVRKARCALNPTDTKLYNIKSAGLASSLRWLNTAPGHAMFLLTASVHGRPLSFTILSVLDASTVGKELLGKYLVTLRDRPLKGLDMDSEAPTSPLKRKVFLGNECAAHTLESSARNVARRYSPRTATVAYCA